MYKYRLSLLGLLLPVLLTAQSLDVSFSVPPGFYAMPISLGLEAEHPDAAIHYTTDGSVPTDADPSYAQPLPLSSRVGTPNGISLIPTNDLQPGHPYREEWLPPQGEVFKIHTIRARAILPDGTAGAVATAAYIVDEAGAQRYSMPVIALAGEPESFFGGEAGIYVPGNTGYNYYQRGSDWERDVHISFFEADGSLAFAQDAGVRIHGGSSRNRPRKSLRLYARSEYGSSWFDYPIFPDKPVDRYKRFLLRNSGNDWSEAVFRDAYLQSLIKGSSEVDIQYSRPAIVFLNGEYWGIHNLRDRFDDRYLQTHYNLDEDRITILEGNIELSDGNEDGIPHYESLYALATQEDMADEARFEQASLMMDMDNYIDYQCLQIFSRNTDWPGNNIAYWRHLDGTPTPSSSYPTDGRWRWMAYDLDFGFGLDFDYVYERAAEYGDNDPAHNTLAYALDPNGADWPNPPWSTALFRNLVENQGFRDRFASRFADLLNTSFSPRRSQELLDEMEGQYRPEMNEHILRWTQPTVSRWEGELTTMRNFASMRESWQRIQLNDHFGLGGIVPIRVEVNSPAFGKVKLNSILIDTTTVGVYAPAYPWEGEYFEEVPVSLVAVPTPGYAFSHWSGDVSASTDTLLWALGSGNAIKAHFVPLDTFPGDAMNPPAHRIAEADYFFGEWDSTEPEGAFPPNMIFQQSDINDPELEEEMTDPYFIPYNSPDDNEYHANDQDKIGFPYSLTGRTRIEALADQGIAFINTGRGRDLGTAVLALDTRGASDLRIDWKAQTLLANSRTYNIRLQYRNGLEGAWQDVLGPDGQPVEYQRADSPSGETAFTELPFPEDAYDQAYMQLRWKYYYTGVRLTDEFGSRDKLRIDDLLVWQKGTSTRPVEKSSTLAGPQLYPCFPNPVREQTTLAFYLPEATRVQIDVFDGLGRRLETPFEGELKAGYHELPYVPKAGVQGTLAYQIRADAWTLSGRMLVVGN